MLDLTTRDSIKPIKGFILVTKVSQDNGRLRFAILLLRHTRCRLRSLREPKNGNILVLLLRQKYRRHPRYLTRLRKPTHQVKHIRQHLRSISPLDIGPLGY